MISHSQRLFLMFLHLSTLIKASRISLQKSGVLINRKLLDSKLQLFNRKLRVSIFSLCFALNNSSFSTSTLDFLVMTDLLISDLSSRWVSMWQIYYRSLQIPSITFDFSWVGLEMSFSRMDLCLGLSKFSAAIILD